ncbi:NADH oxidase [Anaerotignum neopropionicum]|uniref:NADH oxidase n=1 Tax=Anaerotignum neopropionicum TaxID=36847 RepID=A0A136WCI4_9FIRM|nr:FAD-dependent oxidoreductase [Anaerotignum neopropionicum]KXL52235.1 NADH oxidase [Anaerotignum neopropionicum]
METKYKKLFEKGYIGRLEIKNRGVMVPMGTDFSNPDSTASMRLIRYYEERAAGGLGLIINEYTGVDDVTSIPTNYQLRLAQDFNIASCEQLVEAVHRYGCCIFAQLHHAGSTSNPALAGRQSISCSAVPAAPGGAVPRAMTVTEIKEIEQKFVDAAVRAKKAGYDGVELHGAHSYLIGQFLSTYYNKRTDEYGGSFDNRMRFIDEIIDGIRATLGKNFPISVRINGDEMTPDVPETMNLEDGLQIGMHLEAKGIDVLNVSNGSALNGNANCDSYSYTPGWKKHVAKAFKERLSIPIIATNTIKSPAFAEELLEEGVCDFVGLGRSQMADPQFMKKAREGKEDEIRNCIGCMFCRERLLLHRNSVACAVNPRMGREYILGDLKENGQGRPVVVIGAGPGGMEASVVLAKRGFQVTLIEKNDKVGGTLNLASKPPHKELIHDFVVSMKRQMEVAGVKVMLNTEATVELVKSLKPVGVFIASGAKPIVPKMEGIGGANVCLDEEVINKEVKPKGKVAVIGTGLTGLETAEMLGEMGCELTMVEMLDNAGPGIFAVILKEIMNRINKFSPKLLTSHKLIKVTEDGIELENMKDNSKVTVAVDYVVLALGVVPDKQFVEKFENNLGCEVSVIGNAVKGGRIYNAMLDGYTKASVFNA